MRLKVAESPQVAGVIFFTLRQFGYGDHLNLEFLESMLRSGYEVHFAREDISITSEAELERQFPLMFAYDHVTRRDEEMAYEERFAQLDGTAGPARQGDGTRPTRTAAPGHRPGDTFVLFGQFGESWTLRRCDRR